MNNGLTYKAKSGHIYEINRILDFPIYSRKEMPGITTGVNVTKFFDETGGQDENSNIDTPGQFSNTQTYVLHQLQVDISAVSQTRIQSAELAAMATIISSSFMRIVKNKDTVWECPLMKMLVVPTSTEGTLATQSALTMQEFERSLSGNYTFNEPIIFRPGEKFDFTMGSENLASGVLIELMFTMLGFLGIEQEVMTTS